VNIDTKFKLNEVVKEHEVSTEWEYQKTSELLYKFFDIFDKHFFENKLPLGLIVFEIKNKKTLGSYTIAHNGFGAKDEITFNIRHINRPKFKLLSTLLHEMLHLYENRFREDDGTKYTNHHNKFFREKSKEFGIPSNHRGQTLEIINPFLDLVKKHGIDIEEKEIETEVISAKSKMKKWSCKCMNIRSAKEVDATCNNCGQNFEMAF